MNSPQISDDEDDTPLNQTIPFNVNDEEDDESPAWQKFTDKPNQKYMEYATYKKKDMVALKR